MATTEKITENQFKKIVAKYGSATITNHEAGLNYAAISSIASQTCQLRKHGAQVLIVSSGAVAAGRHRLGLINGDSLISKQTLAGVGQPILIEAYRRSFNRYGMTIMQCLLAETDLDKPRLPILRALKEGVVPIINANDVTNDYEMREYLISSDNDRLSAYVTKLVDADLLVLFSDIKGADGVVGKDGQVIRRVKAGEELTIKNLEGSEVGTGGIHSKIEVAREIACRGKVAVIANPRSKDVLLKIAQGYPIGTWFLP